MGESVRSEWYIIRLQPLLGCSLAVALASRVSALLTESDSSEDSGPKSFRLPACWVTVHRERVSRGQNLHIECPDPSLPTLTAVMFMPTVMERLRQGSRPGSAYVAHAGREEGQRSSQRQAQQERL